jgi:hypothetical protein
MFMLPASLCADGTVSDTSPTALLDKLNKTAGLITFATNGTYGLSNWVVRTNTMIDGTGYNVTITASDLARIFTITNNITLTLTNVTLKSGKNAQGAAIYTATNKAGANGTAGSGGHIAGGNGGNGGAAFGGAIYNNQGTNTFIFCTFTNNVATAGNGGNGGNGYNGLGGDGGSGGAGGAASGGVIYNNGVKAFTTINGCFFVHNGVLAGSGGLGGNGGSGSIPGDTGAGGNGSIALGGVIYNSVSARVNVVNTTFFNNVAYGGNTAPQGFTSTGTSNNGQNGGSAYGGAIDSAGYLNLTNCTIFENACVGGNGGDIIHDAAATAGAGGNVGGAGIANTGIFVAKNCTIATNDAFAGTNGVNQVTSIAAERSVRPSTTRFSNTALARTIPARSSMAASTSALTRAARLRRPTAFQRQMLR